MASNAERRALAKAKAKANLKAWKLAHPTANKIHRRHSRERAAYRYFLELCRKELPDANSRPS